MPHTFSRKVGMQHKPVAFYNATFPEKIKKAALKGDLIFALKCEKAQ